MAKYKAFRLNLSKNLKALGIFLLKQLVTALIFAVVFAVFL